MSVDFRIDANNRSWVNIDGGVIVILMLHNSYTHIRHKKVGSSV